MNYSFYFQVEQNIYPQISTKKYNAFFFNFFFTGDIENFVVTDDVVPPGDYSVTIIANDTLGQSATIVVPFTLTGIDQNGERKG